MRVLEIPLIPVVSGNGCSPLPSSFLVEQEERGRSLLFVVCRKVTIPEHMQVS